MVISDTEAVYLYGLDIIAQQQAERLYYLHDGLGSVAKTHAAEFGTSGHSLAMALTTGAPTAWGKDSILSSREATHRGVWLA